MKEKAPNRVWNITFGAENLFALSLRFSQKMKMKVCARIIMTKYYFDIKHTPLVDAAFGPGNASLPNEGIVMGDGPNRYTAQVFLAEVGNLTVYAP